MCIAVQHQQRYEWTGRVQYGTEPRWYSTGMASTGTGGVRSITEGREWFGAGWQPGRDHWGAAHAPVAAPVGSSCNGELSSMCRYLDGVPAEAIHVPATTEGREQVLVPWRSVQAQRKHR